MSIPTFSPVYMTNEEITGPQTNPNTGEAGTFRSAVNPQYCLTEESAQEVLGILQKAYPNYQITIDSRDPVPFLSSGPDAFNLKVPWIKIVDPNRNLEFSQNAGDYANWWASAKQVIEGQNSNDPAVAWRNVQLNVETGLNGN